VGFLVPKRIKLVRVFLKTKKDKILGKNLGFKVCSRFSIGMHRVNPAFSAKNPYNILIIGVLLFEG
tara:strand:+ start:3177 stop:3374 length:198 start_codon:yes stop_codon:yes gene_type:complete